MNTLPSIWKLAGRRALKTVAAITPRQSQPSAAKGSRFTSV